MKQMSIKREDKRWIDRIQTVLFDLDGTLTDSGPGIMNSVKYAMQKAGYEIPDEAVLRSFIGPPLLDSFRVTCGITDEEVYQMIALYREYYEEKGMLENTLYEGVTEMLASLKDAGKGIFMATSKPEKYARLIAEHFEIAPYFDAIGGACMDGTRTEKQEVIEYVLRENGIGDRSTVLMVGDRKYDIEGGKCAGLAAAAVLYGYGSREELEKAKPDLIIETPEELTEILLK